MHGCGQLQLRSARPPHGWWTRALGVKLRRDSPAYIPSIPVEWEVRLRLLPIGSRVAVDLRVVKFERLPPRRVPEAAQQPPPPTPSGATGTALQAAMGANHLLATMLDAAVAAGDQLLEGWAEQIHPFSAEEVPPDMLQQLPDFADPRLDGIAIPDPVQPLRTPFLPLPPLQEPAPSAAPICPRTAADFLPPATRARVQQWLNHQLADLTAIRAALAAGQAPASIVRDRPRPLAIGQGEMHPWARGRVWDCRRIHAECCVVLDYSLPFESDLNLDFLRERLRHYPDQTARAMLTEGVRLDADVELQAVFVPHLTSLSLGFESVRKELRRLHGLGWYDFLSNIPFWPGYFNGQGATARPLEPDRYRRTTEGGGPRQETRDASGLRALSINEASHIYHMPQHFLADQRPEFQQWLAARGLPAPAPLPLDTDHRRSKWPKERKPQIPLVMRGSAVLRRGGELIGLPLYSFDDDVADHFNQMGIATSDLHKLMIIFLADEGELARRGVWDTPAGPQLLFVSEKRLGFGTHGASNIAQRFSDFLLDLFREEMDRLETEARASVSPTERDWLEARLALQRRSGQTCVSITRWTEAPEHALPEIAAPASVDQIPPSYVCPQLRMYTAHMYTGTRGREATPHIPAAEPRSVRPPLLSPASRESPRPRGHPSHPHHSPASRASPGCGATTRDPPSFPATASPGSARRDATSARATPTRGQPRVLTMRPRPCAIGR